MERSQEPEAFTTFERRGWGSQIDGYQRTFARLTAQTVPAMLEAARVGRGHRVLDVCTGHGVLAGAALERGAIVSGLDFAEEVVAAATRNVPGAAFRQGDAQALPYPDASFARREREQARPSDPVILSPGMPGPTSHSYYSQRLRLHYVDWGNADKPPLLLVHGGRDHCRNWDWTAEALRDDWHIIAPDLRGHGDSQWSPDGSYTMAGYIYDLAQLIHQQRLAPVTIIAHSLGGNIALRYSGIYPESVTRLVAIEGLGPPRSVLKERVGKTVDQRMDAWIREQRALAGRLPRRYASIEDAFRRMQEENPHLSAEQARHLTVQGVNQNEDGTYGWKFDNYVRAWPPYDMSGRDIATLWSRIDCPTLLLYGKESQSGNPAEDGRAEPFRHATVVGLEKAGHWLHHDRLDEFLGIVREFLGLPGKESR